MKLRFSCFPITLSEKQPDPANPSLNDVQVLRAGTFYIESDPLEVTSEMLSNMVKNFQDNVRGIDLAVDYKHEAEDIAAGWFKDLYLLNDGQELWAKVEWTPQASKVIADKEFRYLSADFHLNYKNNETQEMYGPTLLGAGLTNRPLVKGMEPVVELSEGKGNPQMDPKDKKIAELEAQVGASEKALSDMKAAHKSLEDQVAQFQKDACVAKEAQMLAEKKSTFDKMLHEGKAVEAQREAFMKDDMIKFAENAGTPHLKAVGSAEHPAPADIKNKEDAEKEVMKFAQKRVADKLSKNLSEAISVVLREHKDLKEKIYG